MNIATIILAAGSSSRMGSIKQLLAVGKTTLLGITVKSALQSKADKVYCVLGANAETIVTSISKYNVEIILNSNYKTGLSSSIVAGIEHISVKDYDAVLIILGDQPSITKAYLNKMIATFKESKNIVASQYRHNFGVPAIIPKKYFNELQKLKGDKGAKNFLNTKKLDITTLQNINLKDIDTKNDYLDYINSTKSE